MHQITNALELFNAAIESGSYLTAQIVRESSRNHDGKQYINRAQFIAMQSDGRVYTFGLNPASLNSGRAKEGQAIELQQVSDGSWDADCATVFQYIGEIDADLYDWRVMCFPIDDNFYPLGE